MIEMFAFSDQQIPPPVNWQKFESLCWDLWRAEWSDPNTKKTVDKDSRSMVLISMED
jgi:hypothetical protein